jgi:L-fucose mutarotase
MLKGLDPLLGEDLLYVLAAMGHGDQLALVDRPQVQAEVLALCQETEGREFEMGSLRREDFYAAAKQAFAVVATGEARPYGCLLLTKGVIFD